MTYAETLDYLYTQLPMYQKVGTAAFKKDLTNIRLLCDAIGNPQRDYPTIHIAGTNGKGTVSHIVAAILQQYGLKVGLYTSPHYIDFRERMKIDGEWISEDAVVDWVSRHRNLMQSIEPSFFEITVAMAFDHFKSEKVDIAIIETGLGGRLDSTNIVTPEVSVITHISLDHQAMLGDTIYQIAGEKAGIIKADIPVVIGRHQTSCDQVFLHKAQSMRSPIGWANLKWDCDVSDGVALFSSGQQSVSVEVAAESSPFLIENIGTALETFSVYMDRYRLPWDSELIAQALSSFSTLTNYIGRWQVIQSSPTVITDSAHNEDAIAKVIAQLSSIAHEQLHMVIGMVNDKDVKKVLSLLPKDAIYYFTQARIPRALHAQELMTQATSYRLEGNDYANVMEAYRAALKVAATADLIYVGGSSFIVGDFLDGLRAT